MLLEGDSHDDDRADIRSTDKPGERRTPLRPVPGEPGGAYPVGYVGKMGSPSPPAATRSLARLIGLPGAAATLSARRHDTALKQLPVMARPDAVLVVLRPRAHELGELVMKAATRRTSVLRRAPRPSVGAVDRGR